MRKLVLTLLIAIAVLGVPAWASAAIRMTKIQYDPLGSDTGSNINQEYVVVKNIGSSAVSLQSWVLKDKANHKYTFGSFKLGAGRSVTIHTGKGTDDRNDLYWGSGAYIWNNDGDKAFLKNAGGNTVDTCSYSGGGQSVNC
jgi:hypothetical protein